MEKSVDQIKTPSWLPDGLAMFSMFFGAGNLVFPLILGQAVQGNVMYALIGLVLTAVLIPFSGLLSISLFDGNYLKFFQRLGKLPGYLIASYVLVLIGPFGGIPRVITFTYSSLSVYFPEINLLWFSGVSCLLIFLFCLRRHKVIEVLGYFLTPILLIALIVFMIKGAMVPRDSIAFPMEKTEAFLCGLKQGYHTMDLLAAFFFSSIICGRVKAKLQSQSTPRMLSVHLLKAASVGMLLLGLVYAGFSTISAVFASTLVGVPSEQLLGVIGWQLLGPMAGIIICLAVALSCLTTAIALTVISADFLRKHLFRRRISHPGSLSIVLLVAFAVSSLEFSGIVKVLGPLLQVAYPALVMLSLMNIAHKLFGFRPVKTPVLFLFLTVLLFTFIH